MRWAALHFDLAKQPFSLKKAQEACDQFCLCNHVIRIDLVLDPEFFERQVLSQNRTEALGGVIAVDPSLICLQSENLLLYDLFREFYRILCCYYPQSISWYQEWESFVQRTKALANQCRKQGKRWIPVKCKLSSQLQPILEAKRRQLCPLWLPYEQIAWQLDQFPKATVGVDLDLALEY